MRAAASVAGAVCLAIALAAVPASAQLRTQVVAQGLSSPVAFIPDPTSATRFFIVEQGGLIRVLDNGVLLQTPFLDLRPPAITFSGEQGLLGMAFKAEIDDTRASLSYKVKRALQMCAREVVTTDPFVTTDPALLPLEQVVDRSDIMILCTPHSAYAAADFKGKPVVDVWGFLKHGNIVS